MENTYNKKNEVSNSVIAENANLKTRGSRIPRPRNLTVLKLELIAERARKIKRIKDAITNGNYAIESKLVAGALSRSFSEKDL
jgi:anti-sigma28 factor (negative regulator of flagellin synthesis)